MSKNPHINPENPESLLNLKVESPKAVAAGIPALISSLKYIASDKNPIRSLKVLNVLNQQHGIDCPGCAWPDPDDERSSLGEYCENGVKAIVEETTSKALFENFFKENSIAQLSILNDYELGKKGRIAEPLYKKKNNDHYEKIKWEDAFKLIAGKLNNLSTPDEAIFYTSGRTSNEAAFLYQLFVRAYGTNNLPDCSNMCHESSGVALNESLGIGKGSVTLEDFYKAQLILILGQNPGTNHPRMLTALQKAKENGAKIVAINPLPETGLIAFNNPQSLKGVFGINAKLSDVFLQVKINGDLPLLQVIEKLLLRLERMNNNVFDKDFIHSNTEGFEKFTEHLDGLDINELIVQTGLDLQAIQEVADLLAQNNRIIVCWAMGLTQHKNAVDTIKEIVNLLLLKGSIGKPGAGTCPVRGHSNVQGDRTMGIVEKPGKQLLDGIKNNYSFDPPAKHGYDVVEAIKAMHEEKAKVFIAMGGNFLSATPDTKFTAEALQKTELTVQISTKLNRSHLITGEEALILPALGRSDKDEINGVEMFVSCENSMGIVQSSKGNLSPLSKEMKSEVAIICEMAKEVLNEKFNIPWNTYKLNYDEIRNSIEKTIPGFERYNERIRERNGFALPNCNRVGAFNTDNKKAKFNLAINEEIKLAEDEYLMMTIRSHDQFNTTIYGLNDRYRGIENERRVVFMNEKDIEKANLKGGQLINLHNNYGGRERVAKKFIIVPYNIPAKCIATYFPEANVLVPLDSKADKSNTPTSKSVIVKIKTF